MKPNFFILGAAKSGTTSLYHYLGQHPEVYLCEPKEPYFFEAEYERGDSYYWKTYFKGWSGQSAIGDAGPRNLYLPYVPERIRHTIPNSRLIAILRNPVDRAYAAWWMNHSEGRDELPFAEAIEDSLRMREQRIRSDDLQGEHRWREYLHEYKKHKRMLYRPYIDMGHYAEQVERYLRLFARPQIKICLFEELQADPAALVKELWRFLAVDADVELTDVSPRRVAIGPIGSRLRRAARNSGVASLVPHPVQRRAATVLASLGDNRPAMDPALRRTLIEYYSAHNRLLGELLERDLSHWNV